MTKEDILSEYHRLCKARGGHVGLRTFVQVTGIPEKAFLGVYWTKWNDFVTEAGQATARFFRDKTDENTVIEALAQLVERLRKWPTENELRLERRHNGSFPSLKVFRRLSQETSLASRLAVYCADRENLSNAARITMERTEVGKNEPPVLGRAPINGYVYMMRSGRRYKIGHTTSPSRRHREVRLDLPDLTTVVHTIPTDDPVGIEAYWQQRFRSKRIRETEFFTLDGSDVAAFKRRKYQ